MMESWVVLLVVGLVVFAGAFGLWYATRHAGTGMLIGGQRDAHGCLGPAGYSYDPEIGACVRSWELTGVSERTAAMAAVTVHGPAFGLSVIGVDPGNCSDGCYTVRLDALGDRSMVVVDHWHAREVLAG